MNSMTPAAAARRLCRPLAMASLLLVVGCTAHSLSSLQQQFGELQNTRDVCEGTAGAPASTNPVTCLSNYDGPLLDVARQARDAAPQAEDPRTSLAFLWLAAMAGWQSRTDEGLDLTDAVSQEGSKRCEDLDKTKFGVPRDCAYLELAPSLARHVRAVNFLHAINYSGMGLTDAQRADLGKQASTYVAGTWDVLTSASGKLEVDPKISPSVIRFLKDQRARIWCVAKEFSRVTKEAGEAEVRDNLVRQTDPIFVNNEDLHSVVCNDTLIGK